ncbi:MAG: class I SAM-dependent methyltransferase [Halovenus sp.]|uniref:class I SAM-dependent methyltransferase n=1 Tax=Halovenus amylolytica TaxID=2500550 RepID=UPI000FE3881B
MAGDPFGRALRDHYHGERTEPLIQRDGEETLEHPIEEFYFGDGDELTEWLGQRLDGPLLDMGAGAGKHALFFQERVETVAIEVNEPLVALLRERGVEDARQGDMFSLREQFDRDRFGSALAYGTQVGLAGSMLGLREFLGDLAYVTGPNARAVIDSYDPTRDGTADLLGYRGDPTPGLASRVMAFEYEGDRGEILLFRLFSPDRLREATIGTPWTVETVRADGVHYLAELAKQ